MYKPYKKPFLGIINYLGKRVRDKKFTDPPIYIGGCGRSGTTLLLSILSSHPHIFACPRELGIFNEIIIDENGNLFPKRIDRLHRTLLLNTIGNSCTRWCEKSPSNILRVNEIDAYHEGNFRFINIVRDGRDVILSRHPTSPDEFWVSPERWINDVSAGFKEKDNPKVHTVRYEDLVLRYEDEIKKICTFLEIPLVDQILNWESHATVRNNRAYFGEVKDIFKTSIGKWKKPENKPRTQELVRFDKARELLSFYGYEAP